MGNHRIQLSSEDEGYASFFTELDSVELNEKGLPTKIQALPMGKFRHPIYGKMVLDEKKLSEFANNWSANVRGQDLDIDLDHKKFNSEAAGWVTGVELNTTDPDPKRRGLWYTVDWTQLGEVKLTSRAYRYFSSDYFDTWTDPTGTVHKNVLNGGALTNRPYLKGMKPIVLSEDDERQVMDRDALEKLARTLGVTFTADISDADLQSKVNEAALAIKDSDPEDNGDDEGTEDSGTDKPELVGAAAQLSENDLKNPAVQALLSEMRERDERLAKVEMAHRLSEVNRKLGEFGNGKFTLTPKAKEKARKILLNESLEKGDEIMDLISLVAEDGIRQLGELGSGRSKSDQDSANAISDFEAAALKLSEETKISMIDAYDRVAQERPELYQAYSAAIFGGN